MAATNGSTVVTEELVAAVEVVLELGFLGGRDRLRGRLVNAVLTL